MFVKKGTVEMQFVHLDEACVLKDLVGVTNKFELLHYSHGFIQFQDHSCG